MKIHPNWLRPQRTSAFARICQWCGEPFAYGTSRRMYCGEESCDRERDKVRKQEQSRLAQMMKAADAKRQRQKDELIASVNAVLADAS